MNSEKKEIKIIKTIYVWINQKNDFEYKYKIIKSVDKNLSLPLTSIFRDQELILKPRSIYNNPFDNENSLIIFCDLFKVNGECINYDKRHELLINLKNLEEIITECKPQISFKPCFEIKPGSIIMVDQFINLCLKAKIDIYEYETKNLDNKLVSELVL